MEETSNWIPNVHPLLVHFPIALLFIAMAIELLGLVLKKYQQYSFIADVLVWTGTLFGVVTLITGLQAADALTAVSADAMAAIESHALSAKVTLASLIVYSVIRILRYRNREKIKRIAVIGVLLFGFFVLTGIYYTADKGAKLVYKYGIGVTK